MSIERARKVLLFEVKKVGGTNLFEENEQKYFSDFGDKLSVLVTDLANSRWNHKFGNVNLKFGNLKLIDEGSSLYFLFSAKNKSCFSKHQLQIFFQYCGSCENSYCKML
jgi:hypothetical protein